MSFGELLLPVGSKPYFGQRPTLVDKQMHVEHGAWAEAHRPNLLPPPWALSLPTGEGSWGTKREEEFSRT